MCMYIYIILLRKWSGNGPLVRVNFNMNEKKKIEIAKQAK